MPDVGSDCGKGDTSFIHPLVFTENPPKKAGAMPSNEDKSPDKRQFYPQDPPGGTDPPGGGRASRAQEMDHHLPRLTEQQGSFTGARRNTVSCYPKDLLHHSLHFTRSPRFLHTLEKLGRTVNKTRPQDNKLFLSAHLKRQV